MITSPPKKRPNNSAKAQPTKNQSQKTQHQTQPLKSDRPTPKDLPDPLWLKGLTVTQNLTIISAIGLVGSLLAVYGWSVHTQAQWNRQYNQLLLLKRQERTLGTAIEAFENDIVANLHRLTSNLVREDRSQSLYLPNQPVSIPPAPTPAPRAIRPIRGY